MIQSELELVIVAKLAGTVQGNHGPGTTLPKNNGYISGPGDNYAKTQQVRFLDRYGNELNRFSGPNPDRWQVTWIRCYH